MILSESSAIEKLTSGLLVTHSFFLQAFSMYWFLHAAKLV